MNRRDLLQAFAGCVATTIASALPKPPRRIARLDKPGMIIDGWTGDEVVATADGCIIRNCNVKKIAVIGANEFIIENNYLTPGADDYGIVIERAAGGMIKGNYVDCRGLANGFLHCA